MSNIAINGSTLLMGVIAILLLITALVLLFKYKILNKDPNALTEANAGKKFFSPLAARVKYPEVNGFKFSNTFFALGLATSLALTWMAFNWTQYEDQIFIPDDAMEFDEEIEMVPPRTAEPPPPPPPPPPPVIEEVPEEEIEEEEEFIPPDQSIEADARVEIVRPEKKAPPPPPPPPPPEPEAEEIFKVVEQMPRFPGCEDKGSSDAIKECAQTKLLEFIYKNIKYPAIARENGVQGGAVVRFVVEKDGSIADPEILRDPGAGCGAEALRVINLMNQMPQKWTPGKQRGRAVRVQFNLPVKFKLE